jgi:hypothetical protein
MKKQVLRRTAVSLAVSTVFLLTACGGGGGGGGGGYVQPDNTNSTVYLRGQVPFATPVLAAVVAPFVNSSSQPILSDMYAADLSGNGGQNVVSAGVMSGAASSWSNSKISVLGWSNGRLVDQTSQWFPTGDNVVPGVSSIKFASFNNNGHQDMLVSTTSDGIVPVTDAYIYFNNGSSFSKYTIPLTNINSHDSVIYDVNQDGYSDVFLTDYGPRTSLLLNNKNGTFTTYQQNQSVATLWGTSSIAVGDFLNNGTTTLIATDIHGPAPVASNATKLYSFGISSGYLTFNELATLPTPRFELSKWASYNFGDGVNGASHNVRAVAYDWDGSGIMDAIILSRPNMTNGTWPSYSEIQFLKNNGSGSFTDVTDSILVGYNNNTPSSYNIKFVDINRDGLTDILLSSQEGGSQFLLKTSDGKYVAAYQNVLSDFTGQVNSMQGTTGQANTVTIVKSPDNKSYLLTSVQYVDKNVTKQAFYLSLLGDASGTVITPVDALAAIKAKWPYMTDVQANTVLAKTQATYFNSTGVILDPNSIDSVFQPVGNLGIPVAGQTLKINGYVAGLGLSVADTQMIATDQLGRDYSINMSTTRMTNYMNGFQSNTEHIDQYNLTSHAEYLINGPVNTYNGMRLGSETRLPFSNNDLGPGLLQKPTQYSFGIPEVYRNGRFTYGTQYTNLNSNPWIAFGGSWGTVTNSGILDNVVTYQDGGFSTQASLMHVTTNITPGLITKVNNIVGTWAETGYRYTQDRFGDIGVYAGVKPMVLSGNVEAKIPTSVDNAGNVAYTNKKLAIQNEVTPYVRALYTNMIDKKTMYRFSAMGTQQGQYRLMHELRFWID